MIRENIVDGIRTDENRFNDCADCKLSKCRRVSHKSRTAPKASRSGETLHFDIMGRITPDGIMGEKFILVIKDEGVLAYCHTP
jgi:hypothetical protein